LHAYAKSHLLRRQQQKDRDLRPAWAKVIETLSQKRSEVVAEVCGPIYSGGKGRRFVIRSSSPEFNTQYYKTNKQQKP
jgi:hypothetical protein